MRSIQGKENGRKQNVTRLFIGIETGTQGSNIYFARHIETNKQTNTYYTHSHRNDCLWREGKWQWSVEMKENKQITKKKGLACEMMILKSMINSISCAQSVKK